MLRNDGAVAMMDGADREPAMEAEFDVVARWTLEAVQRLGPDHAIPAGCRGSASPAALAWLGEACELADGARMLDAGGGVGGPAAYAAERFGVRPVLVEPMVGACRAAATLFGLATVVGTAERLPLVSGSVDAAWCLGVLCTTTNQAGVLGELRRVLRQGGPLGLLVMVAAEPHPVGAPDGNTFPSGEQLAALVAGTGFDVVERVDAADFAAAPVSWAERIDAVEAEVRRAHGDDPRYAVARDQEDRMGRLITEGRVTARLLHAVAR